MRCRWEEGGNQFRHPSRCFPFVRPVTAKEIDDADGPLRRENGAGIFRSVIHSCFFSFLFPSSQKANIPSAIAYELYDYRFNDFSLEDEETLKVSWLNTGIGSVRSL